eukprot:scaffold34492_cov211-Skeletonema_menzelii.AAC.1
MDLCRTREEQLSIAYNVISNRNVTCNSSSSAQFYNSDAESKAGIMNYGRCVNNSRNSQSLAASDCSNVSSNSNAGVTSDNKKSHPSLRNDVVNNKNEPDTPIWPTRYLQTKQGDRYHEYISPAHDRCTDLEQAAAAAAAVDASFKSWRSCDNDSDVVERASSSLKQPSKYYGIEEQCPKESNGSAATPVNPHHPSETDIPASTPSGEESAVDPTILPALLYAAGAQPASVRAYRRCSEDRSLMGRQAIRDHLYDSPSTSRLPRTCLDRLFHGSSDSTVKDFPCCNATSVAR